MNHREYERTLNKWEAEGYDVSELRQKWFSAARVKDRRHVGKWVIILVAVFIVVLGVAIWQASQPSPHVAPAPSPAPAPAQVPQPTPAPVPKPAPAPAPALAPAPAPTYILSASVNPSGAGSVSPSSGNYESGGTVTLAANPASGYRFDSWSGDISGSSPSINVIMDSNKKVVANFSKVVTETPLDDGTVASDIPGTALSLGASRGSVVDEDTKPRDVYALSLTAGQEVQIRVTNESGSSLRYQLANPGSQSFERENVTLAFNETAYTWDKKFVPPVTGTYYLAVIARSSAQPYTVEVWLTGG